MATQTQTWVRVSREHPCPVCEHTDWCAVGARLVHCMRVEGPRMVSSGGWLHQRDDVPKDAPRVLTPKPKRTTDVEQHNRWAPQARAKWRGNEDAARRLATLLGVASWTLEALRIGWDGSGWWCPERNHLGLIVGINRRDTDGKKKCLPGSRRGLTYADDWHHYPGPILIVEGASDVAAGLTLRLATIGRPSNTGGIEYLTRLLRPVTGRRIVVIGELDRKPHETLPDLIQSKHDPKCRGCAACWPGKYGAIHVAKTLAQRLGRYVEYVLPPREKDLRGWLIRQGIDVENEAECAKAGRKVLRWL